MRRIQRDRLANQLAADIEAAIGDVDNLAMPGTYLHQQHISATLYENLPKIRALIRAVRAEVVLNRPRHRSAR